MSRMIEEGDAVEVRWASSHDCPGGIVLNRPAQTGDLWYIQNHNGDIYAINPNSSNFEGIIKRIKERP
jgi:hypothetical protein